MKFMSDFKELEGQVYNSINECKDAENKVLKEREAREVKERDKSKLRKKLSGEVEAAEADLKKAYENYEAAKETARKMIEEYNKKIQDLLNPAKEAVKEAQLAKISELDGYCADNNVKIGIITVGQGSAQEVCDKLISAGIGAIWNFAPCALEVPDGVVLKQENLALSLAHLNSQTKNKK